MFSLNNTTSQEYKPAKNNFPFPIVLICIDQENILDSMIIPIRHLKPGPKDMLDPVMGYTN
jgi:hypothetical protein